MRAALYARVSTADKDQTNENQLLRLREYCRARGWTWTEFTDVASGADDNRPGMHRMMEAARRREIDIILAVRLDRLYRSAANMLAILRDLEGWSVSFTCLDQPIDTSNASGRLLTTVIAAVAEFERELISDRVKDGMARAKAGGARLGKRPKKEIDLARARELRSAGRSYAEISGELRVPRSSVYDALRSDKGAPPGLNSRAPKKPRPVKKS